MSPTVNSTFLTPNSAARRVARSTIPGSMSAPTHTSGGDGVGEAEGYRAWAAAAVEQAHAGLEARQDEPDLDLDVAARVAVLNVGGVVAVKRPAIDLRASDGVLSHVGD